MRKEKTPITISYIGQKKSIESELIRPLSGVAFYTIPAGKLRRYFSLSNIIDVFKVCAGIIKSIWIILRIKPDVIFCKGGFVSFPVGFAGVILRKPVIIHESDVSPGLTTKMLSKIASTICVSFAETKKYFAQAQLTGNPVRKSILNGTKQKALQFLKWKKSTMPTVLVMGGSSGAKNLNSVLITILPDLLETHRVIHITGKGKEKYPHAHENYRCYEYLHTELANIYALTDIIISRAGANSIAEIISVQIPAVLVPLSKNASRGDQIENAEQLSKHNAAVVVDEETVTPQAFLDSIKNLDIKALSTAIKKIKSQQTDANRVLIDICKQWQKK